MLFISLSFLASSSHAGVFLSWDEAVALAFKDCKTTRERIFLEKKQVEKARELCGQSDVGAIWVRVRGDCPGAAGPRYAYADAHRVRTKNESLMIVIDSEGQVERLEVLSFDEPPEYQPKPAWYERFKKQKLSEDFDMGRAIPFVTGASLTTRSTVQAARRGLAVHAQIPAKPL